MVVDISFFLDGLLLLSLLILAVVLTSTSRNYLLLLFLSCKVPNANTGGNSSYLILSVFYIVVVFKLMAYVLLSFGLSILFLLPRLINFFYTYLPLDFYESTIAPPPSFKL
jgi:hypothetical protein